ncbi:MAG: chitobiase/beta-hexosaminidase C-terminal domain-containing protein [Oscillospiraceae bacterium]|nr:chitobiase/beta-hexosaminidase C-terminal domain-containing protein [Oscillospiraceae bacterium]
MAINLHVKYDKDIQTEFVKESILNGRLDNSYSFTGVRTVKISTPITVPMVDYVRSGANRYGTPKEMEDIVQELTLSQDKAFTLTIDKGNNADQNNIKEAGKMLKLQMAEQAIPLMDKYGFARLSQLAGKIVGNSTAISKSNVCERITAGTTFMDDSEVPSNDRTLFVPSDVYAKLRLSDEFKNCDGLLEKSLAKGQVGTYDGMCVVKVPAKRWPQNVNFIIIHKRAGCAPVKLNDTKYHKDPPGISGDLLEGRQYYDLFVYGAKCNGVYVDVNTASGAGVICATPEVLPDGTIECATDGAIVKYTTDGSDPRYSASASVGTEIWNVEDGTTVRAYAYKDGAFPSEVAEGKIE